MPARQDRQSFVQHILSVLSGIWKARRYFQPICRRPEGCDDQVMPPTKTDRGQISDVDQASLIVVFTHPTGPCCFTPMHGKRREVEEVGHVVAVHFLSNAP